MNAQRVPSSTYRLQIRKSFDLDAAADVVGYLDSLGVGAVYLSPLLQATAGSDHGYDVTDPTRIDPTRGGAEGLDRLAWVAHERGLGVIADIVPNHQGVSAPRENLWWWDVLRLGRASAWAEAFDIDWEYGGGRVRLPILGSDLDAALAAGEVTIEGVAGEAGEDGATDASGPTPTEADAPDGVARYFEHTLPLAPGSLDGLDPSDPDYVRDVIARQHWEPILWRREANELNYRRFFAVSTLAGVRVEVPWVFEASHREILRWIRTGVVDGLRVDHPDGLAEPGVYLDRLAEATARARAEGGQGEGPVPVWVEKILEHTADGEPERLPGWWASVGTTGYDALALIDRVLIDPAGHAGLASLDARLRAESGLPPAPAWHDLIAGTKREIARGIQGSEVARLLRLAPGRFAGDEDALVELLAAFGVYRAYLPAGRDEFDAAVDAALAARPDLTAAIERWAELLTQDPAGELARRFGQTTGPVTAKGVEDTAFYRHTLLGSLTEVGADPAQFAVPVERFHAEQVLREAASPHSMTTLSTHDTKRGEDVRARLDALAEVPDEWASVLDHVRQVATSGHGPLDNLLAQAALGAWPISAERLHAYAEKAAREAGEATAWLDVDDAFEERMHALVDALATGDARPLIEGFAARLEQAGYSNGLAAKLLQLAGPGMPDVYQGSELWERSLVDPDNRRAVDFGERARLLARIDEGWMPPLDASDADAAAAKLLVVAHTLRLRRERPELFGGYRVVTAVGEASGHVVAFDRGASGGGAIAVATRLPIGLEARGGWRDTAVLVPRASAAGVPLAWRDEFTGRVFGERVDAGGGASSAGAGPEASVAPIGGLAVPLAELLETYPVALLVPEHA